MPWSVGKVAGFVEERNRMVGPCERGLQMRTVFSHCLNRKTHCDTYGQTCYRCRFKAARAVNKRHLVGRTERPACYQGEWCQHNGNANIVELNRTDGVSDTKEREPIVHEQSEANTGLFSYYILHTLTPSRQAPSNTLKQKIIRYASRFPFFVYHGCDLWKQASKQINEICTGTQQTHLALHILGEATSPVWASIRY